MRIATFLSATLLLLAASAWAQPLTPAIFYYASAPELTPGGTVAGELTERSGQNFKDGSRVEVVVLRAEAGQALVLDVTSDDFDAFLSVYASDGTLLDQNDDGPTSVDPQLAFTPPVDGAYLLVVSGFGAWDLGAFRVSARGVEPVKMQALPLSGVVSDELRGDEPTDPEVGYGPTRFYEMVVEEPSLVRLQLSSLDFDTVLTLFDEVGWLDQNDDAGGTTDSQLFLELGPGTYRVAVSAWGAGAGAFTLQADRYVRAD
jgi:hypothetical protein